MRRKIYEEARLYDKDNTLRSKGNGKTLLEFAMKYGQFGWYIIDERGYRIFIF